MAQLFDPLMEPGTVIDKETGLPVPNMPVVGPAVEALDAGLEGLAGAVTPIAGPGATQGPTPAPNAELVNTLDTAPQYVNQKIGATKTTTTTEEQTPELREALDQGPQLQADVRAASAQEQASVAEQNRIESEKTKKIAEASAQVEQARYEVMQDNRLKLESELLEIQEAAKELANAPRKSYFDNLSGGQKFLAALSVGLGSYGQALTGSGQNVGMAILQKRIEQFDKEQDDARDKAFKALDQRRLNSQTRLQMASQIEKEFDARKLSLTEKLKGEFDSRMALAKTPQQQAAIQMKQSEILSREQRQLAELAQKTAARQTITTEQDIIQKVIKTPGVDANGNPIKLTESQGKARMALGEMKASDQVINETAAAAKSPAMEYFLKEVGVREGMQRWPMGVGWVGVVGRDIFRGTPEEGLADQDPEAARYYTAANTWTAAYLRFKSGAAISIEEAAKEYKKYWPMPGDTDKILSDKTKLRDAAEKEMAANGGI